MEETCYPVRGVASSPAFLVSGLFGFRSPTGTVSRRGVRDGGWKSHSWTVFAGSVGAFLYEPQGGNPVPSGDSFRESRVPGEVFSQDRLRDGAASSCFNMSGTFSTVSFCRTSRRGAGEEGTTDVERGTFSPDGT